MNDHAKADVIVVGLGPVGMVVAGLLGRQGLSVIGLDQALDVFHLPRAAHIDHTGLRTLQAVGCLDELLPEMIENPGIEFVGTKGERLALIPGSQPNPSNLPASMYFHQPGFDRLLRGAVAALPTVELLVGHEVIGVESLADEVVVRAVAPDGSPLELSGRYVVAADGAASPVREALGIQLADLGFHGRWLVVDLLLREPRAVLPDRAVTYCRPERPLGFVPMPGQRCRFELMLHDEEDDEAMQDPAEVARLVDGWIPPGAAELERSAVYFFHGLIAESWRAGRVFLAGDAAHQMPPFLGQGMNSGFRDATNLSWKLGLVLQDKAADSLLATYELERKPHVGTIVEASVRIGHIVCAQDVAMTDGHTDDSEHAASLKRTLSFRLPRLERGPLVLSGGGQLATQAIAYDGARFDDVVGERFLVLGRDELALESGDWWATEVGALVGTPDYFPAYVPELSSMLDRLHADVVVVRPDRYVLAAGARLDAITDQVRPVLEPQVSRRS
jgi:3-(3-hydroxy-phenyl)propionate hydroxylase